MAPDYELIGKRIKKARKRKKEKLKILGYKGRERSNKK